MEHVSAAAVPSARPRLNRRDARNPQGVRKRGRVQLLCEQRNLDAACLGDVRQHNNHQQRLTVAHTPAQMNNPHPAAI